MKDIITIDGPSGSGKSTVSKLLAQRLGYNYLDTGALYRAVAWKVKECGVDIENEKKLGNVLEKIDISFNGNSISVNGTDVTLQIRTPEIGELSSRVSAKPVVRKHLFEIQRRIGLKGKAVIEGRDIGTVIFPEAENKFFLDATADERGRRRHKELVDKDVAAGSDLKTTVEDIKERDRRDSTRQDSPLKKTDDMVYIDTSSLTIEAVVEKIIGSLNISG